MFLGQGQNAASLCFRVSLSSEIIPKRNVASRNRWFDFVSIIRTINKPLRMQIDRVKGIERFSKVK